MKDYKFKLVKEVDVVIPALTEEEAWVEIAKLDPDMIADGWQIQLINSNQQASIIPQAQEDFYDPMNELESFDDLSYLNPHGPQSL